MDFSKTLVVPSWEVTIKTRRDRAIEVDLCVRLDIRDARGDTLEKFVAVCALAEDELAATPEKRAGQFSALIKNLSEQSVEAALRRGFSAEYVKCPHPPNISDAMRRLESDLDIAAKTRQEAKAPSQVKRGEKMGRRERAALLVAAAEALSATRDIIKGRSMEKAK